MEKVRVLKTVESAGLRGASKEARREQSQVLAAFARIEPHKNLHAEKGAEKSRGPHQASHEA